MHWWPLLFAMIIVGPTCGCGDPLVSGDSLDKATFTLQGAIAPYDDARPLAIGVLWVDPALAGGPPSVSDAEQLEAEITTDGTFSLNVFGHPPKNAIKRLAADPASNAVALAWGELVLFEDNDSNGRFEVNTVEEGALMTAPDRYAGVAESDVLLYIEEPAEEGTQIIGLARTLAETGYVVGEAHCVNAAYVTKVEPTMVSIRAVEGTPRFPRVRQCFESIP